MLILKVCVYLPSYCTGNEADSRNLVKKKKQAGCSIKGLMAGKHRENMAAGGRESRKIIILPAS